MNDFDYYQMREEIRQELLEDIQQQSFWNRQTRQAMRQEQLAQQELDDLYEINPILALQVERTRAKAQMIQMQAFSAKMGIVSPTKPDNTFKRMNFFS